jgi:hypothetical protein
MAAWATTQAAPLVNISLEGRKAGTTAWLKEIPDAAQGDTIEFRVLLNMAPVGTSNTQRDPATQQMVTTTINSLNAQLDGMNSLFLKVAQNPADSMQVNFLRGPIQEDPDTGEPRDYQTDILPAPWRAGTGAFGGNLVPRTGTPHNDLADIRPVRAAGSFAGAGANPAIVMNVPSATGAPFLNVGRFQVMSNGVGTIMPMWGGSTSGGGRVNATDANSPPFFVTNDTQANSADPIVGFSPLIVGVPEPSTFVLAGLGLVGLAAFARRRKA